MKSLWFAMLLILLAGTLPAQQGPEWSFSVGDMKFDGIVGDIYDRGWLYDVSYSARAAHPGRMVWSFALVQADESQEYVYSGYEENHWSRISHWIFAPIYRWENPAKRVFSPFVEGGFHLAFSSWVSEGWYTDPHSGAWVHVHDNDADIKLGWQAGLGVRFKLTPRHSLILKYQILRSFGSENWENVYDLEAQGVVAGYSYSF